MLFRTLKPGTVVLVARANSAQRQWEQHTMRLQRLYWSAYARDGRTRSTVFKDGDFLIKAKNKDVATVRRRWSH